MTFCIGAKPSTPKEQRQIILFCSEDRITDLTSDIEISRNIYSRRTENILGLRCNYAP